MSEMWIWIGLIAGIIFALISCLPEPDVAKTRVETVTLNELEEWDLQDHLEELDEEE